MSSHLLIELSVEGQGVLCAEPDRQRCLGQMSHGPDDISRQCYPMTTQPERPERRNNSGRVGI